MFRVLLTVLVALRITCCPLVCTAGSEESHAECDASAPHQRHACEELHETNCDQPSQFEFDVCHHHHGPLYSECPGESPSPCDDRCVCKVLPELNVRAISKDLMLSWVAKPLALDDVYCRCSAHDHNHHPTHEVCRPDGRSVRISHSSLLI